MRFKESDLVFTTLFDYDKNLNECKIIKVYENSKRYRIQITNEQRTWMVEEREVFATRREYFEKQITSILESIDKLNAEKKKYEDLISKQVA